MQPHQVNSWVVNFLPVGGDEEELLSIIFILLIPLPFLVGTKELWTHHSIVRIKPLWAKDRREERRELKELSRVNQPI